MNSNTLNFKEKVNTSRKNTDQNKKSGGQSILGFADNREEAITQRKLHKMVVNSPQLKTAAQLQSITNGQSGKRLEKNEQNEKFSFAKQVTNKKNKSATHYNPDVPAQLVTRTHKSNIKSHFGINHKISIPDKNSNDNSQQIVQRFPATALENNTDLNWEQTDSVTRPGEGVSGGVYIFHDLNGPVNDLVIKPEYEEEEEIPQSMASGQISDKLLKGLGFNVPDSRVVKPDNTETSQIINVAASKGQNIPDSMEIGGDELNLAFLKIMGKADAKSFSRAANETDTKEKVPALLSVLNRPELMKKIGKLIVADAFMRNSDRIDQFKSNLGNLMFHENELTAIDSGAQFKEFESKGKVKKQIDLEQIEGIFSNRREHIESLFLGLQILIPNEQAKAEFDKYLKTEEAEAARNAIGNGMAQGITDIRNFLNNKQNRSNVKDEMNRYKEAGATHMEYSRLKTAKRYIDIRAQGTEEMVAAKRAVDYEKFPERLAQLVAFPANITALPVLPPKLSRKEKIGRGLSIKNADEKRASEFKKELRGGEKNASEIDLSSLPNAGRRGDKLNYEIKIRLFISDLQEKIEAIQNLVDPENPYANKMYNKAVGPLENMREELLALEAQYAVLANRTKKTKIFVPLINTLGMQLKNVIAETIGKAG